VDVFSNPANREYAADYLKDLRESWRNIDLALGRSIMVAILAMAVFELLARSAINKAVFSGFEIKDLSLIRTALPVIVAYYFYDLSVLFYVDSEFEKAHSRIIEILHEDISKENVDYFIRPRQPSILGALLPARENRVTKVFNTTFGISLYAGIFLFEIYAYYLEFTRLRSDLVLIVAALVLSALFVFYGLFIMFGGPKEQDVHIGQRQEGRSRHLT
jgi:hypothetical protein